MALNGATLEKNARLLLPVTKFCMVVLDQILVVTSTLLTTEVDVQSFLHCSETSIGVVLDKIVHQALLAYLDGDVSLVTDNGHHLFRSRSEFLSEDHSVYH